MSTFHVVKLNLSAGVGGVGPCEDFMVYDAYDNNRSEYASEQHHSKGSKPLLLGAGARATRAMAIHHRTRMKEIPLRQNSLSIWPRHTDALAPLEDLPINTNLFPFPGRSVVWCWISVERMLRKAPKASVEATSSG